MSNYREIPKFLKTFKNYLYELLYLKPVPNVEITKNGVYNNSNFSFNKEGITYKTFYCFENVKGWQGNIKKEEFKGIKNNQFCIILMINKTSNSGHYISIFKYKNINYYFDPLGFSVDEEIKKNLNGKIENNLYRIQELTSTLCGHYCVMFIYMMFDKIIASWGFDKIFDYIKNEDIEVFFKNKLLSIV